MPPCQWPFAISIHVYMCVHVCVCVHVHMCGDTPHGPRQPPPACPIPRATGSPKYQNSMSLELIKIIGFCLKILYLWTLLNSYRLQLFTPERNPNRKNYNNSWTNRDKFNSVWRFGTPEFSCTHIDLIWCVGGGVSYPKRHFYVFFAPVTLW